MKTKVSHTSDKGEVGTPVFSIETPEGHHAARDRIKALEGSSRDEDGERELEALKQAVAQWERKRPPL